jgi:hypothetical protein
VFFRSFQAPNALLEPENRTWPLPNSTAGIASGAELWVLWHQNTESHAPCNRCVHVPIFQQVVELLGGEIQYVDLIVNLFGIHPILKQGLVQDGFDDRLRSKEELRGIAGEVPICIAGLGAWSNIEIKTRIGVLKAGCRTLRGAVVRGSEGGAEDQELYLTFSPRFERSGLKQRSASRVRFPETGQSRTAKPIFDLPVRLGQKNLSRSKRSAFLWSSSEEYSDWSR